MNRRTKRNILNRHEGGSLATEWHDFDWAGGQKYGRAINQPHLADMLKIGDWVEIQTEKAGSPYNGFFEVVSLDDDDPLRTEYKGRLVGIGLFTDSSISGRIKKSVKPLEPEVVPDPGTGAVTDPALDVGPGDTIYTSQMPQFPTSESDTSLLSTNVLLLAGAAIVGFVLIINK